MWQSSTAEAGGFRLPEFCKEEDSKAKYTQDHYDKEGIQLNPKKMAVNKAMPSTFWDEWKSGYMQVSDGPWTICLLHI